MSTAPANNEGAIMNTYSTGTPAKRAVPTGALPTAPPQPQPVAVTLPAMFKVPARFYEDHRFTRDCGQSGVIVKELARHYIVLLDDDAYSDLESDADYYVDGGVAEFGPDYLGLISSARATLKALTRAVTA